MFFTLEKKEVLVRKFSFGVFSLQKGEQLLPALVTQTNPPGFDVNCKCNPHLSSENIKEIHLSAAQNEINTFSTQESLGRWVQVERSNP